MTKSGNGWRKSPEFSRHFSAFACLSNQQSRDQVVSRLPDEARSRIKRFPNDLQDVDNILHTCLSFDKTAWRQLFEAVRFYEGLAFGRRFLNKRFNTLAESQNQILKELDRLDRPLLARLQ